MCFCLFAGVFFAMAAIGGADVKSVAGDDVTSVIGAVFVCCAYVFDTTNKKTTIKALCAIILLG